MSACEAVRPSSPGAGSGHHGPTMQNTGRSSCDKEHVFPLFLPDTSVSGCCRESKSVAASIPSHTRGANEGLGVFKGIIPAPKPGLHLGGAVLYKAQRSGIFRAARVVAFQGESVTVAFPRCGVERTVAWNTVVAFTDSQVDQQWKSPEQSAPVAVASVSPEGGGGGGWGGATPRGVRRSPRCG